MTTKKITFAVADYVVFGVCLTLSCAIGMWYACTGGKQKTTDEFFMADRKMKFGPVALSLMVSFISAITVLGVPAEVYLHGTGYCFLALSYFICFPIVAHFFIPIFYERRITSVYEYLEFRFSKVVRVCATVTYMLMVIIYMGVVLYTPALALNAVTEINVWSSVLVLCLVCTVYTTLGGLKAVIWTDVFQALIMIGGQIVVIIVGTNQAGGFGKVWQINHEAGKIASIEWNPSPFERHTIWTLTVGGAFMCLTLYGTSQTAVQRYLSCQSETHARITAYLNLPLLIIVMMISCLLGMTMYATYHCNNPLASGAISKPDQLLIYYVMDLLGDYPGLPGLFVACLFSAALSTVSSCLNVLAMLTMQDLIKPFRNISNETFWSKILAVGYGVLCLIMSGIASTLGSVLIAAISIFGIIGGPLLGVFVLGICCRRANAKGALAGFFSALIFIFCIGFGSIAYFIMAVPSPKYIQADQACPTNWTGFVQGDGLLPANISTGTINTPTLGTHFLNDTNASPPVSKLYDGPRMIFRLSYMWYSGFSALVVLLVGWIVSFVAEKLEPDHPAHRERDVVLHALPFHGGSLRRGSLEGYKMGNRHGKATTRS